VNPSHSRLSCNSLSNGSVFPAINTDAHMHMLYMPRPLYSGMRFNSVGGLDRLCSGDERKLAARMGAGSSSRVASLRKAIRENDPSVIEVSLEGLQLSDKTVRKLSDALRQNRLARTETAVNTCSSTCGERLQHSTWRFNNQLQLDNLFATVCTSDY